jgi:hypothetical protein
MLLQSHHVETLRALAPSLRTHNVPCHHLLYTSANISPLLNPFVCIVAAASAAWLPARFVVANLPVILLALHCGSPRLGSRSRYSFDHEAPWYSASLLESYSSGSRWPWCEPCCHEAVQCRLHPHVRWHCVSSSRLFGAHDGSTQRSRPAPCT